MDRNADTFAMSPGIGLARAMAEAERCLLCHDAPCSSGCPAGTDPGTFIRKLRLQNIKGAIRTIKTNNVLGGACGALCPAPRLCEAHCSATGISRPVEIANIQRALIEHSWQIGFQPLPARQPSGPRVAIVGGGPAGLSCAAELAQAGCQPVVFDALPEPGGNIRFGVPSYRFSAEFLAHELEDLRRLGVEFRCNEPVAGPAAAEDLLQQGFAAVFLAPGLWQSLRLNGGGPAPAGLHGYVEFLAGLRSGKRAALAGQFAGQAVAVIGGGSVAMDCAQSAVRLGARDVFLIYRRSYAQMPAEEDERIVTLNEGVHFLLLNQPVGYLANSAGRIRAVALRRTALGDPDPSGRRAPREIAGSDWELPVDAVIEAIGAAPAAGSPDWYPNVKVDGNRLIAADPDSGRTSVPGIFAGGDIVRGPALVVHAVQDGKTAARSIIDYLGQGRNQS